MNLFETNRLYARKFITDDWGSVREYAVYKQQTGFEVFDLWPTDPEQCKGLTKYFANSDSFWAICRKSDDQLIGFVSFNEVDTEKHLDMGHGFIPQYTEEGMAEEAIESMMQYAFDTMSIVAIDARNEKEWVEQITPLKNIGFQELEDRMQFTRKCWEQR